MLQKFVEKSRTEVTCDSEHALTRQPPVLAVAPSGSGARSCLGSGAPSGVARSLAAAQGLERRLGTASGHHPGSFGPRARPRARQRRRTAPPASPRQPPPGMGMPPPMGMQQPQMQMSHASQVF